LDWTVFALAILACCAGAVVGVTAVVCAEWVSVRSCPVGASLPCWSLCSSPRRSGGAAFASRAAAEVRMLEDRR